MFDIAPLLGGFSANWFTVATGATPQVLIPPDPNRPILYITNFTATPLLLAVDPAPPASSTGQFIVNSNDTVGFTWIMDGPMSTFGWYLWTPAGAGVAAWTQVRWLPKQIGG